MAEEAVNSGDIPGLLDVIEARRRIARYVPATPLYHYLSLDRLLDAQIYVKHENHHALGAFKVRGGVNLVSQLSEEERELGVITASTGNHGQSIAYASGLLGVRAIIVVPERANPGKVESIRNLGGEVIFHGETFDDARKHVERLSREEGYRYIHSADEPALIAGVGTYTLEIIEELPDVDVIIVPVGGGSGACGTCITAKGLNPRIQVIAVQAAEAPAAYLSWKEGHIIEAPNRTRAEGLATQVGFELTQTILRNLLDDFILATEEELDEAIVLHLEKTHNLTEHAGAASLAAAFKIKDQIYGKKVALVLSGGNISLPHLRTLLA